MAFLRILFSRVGLTLKDMKTGWRTTWYVECFRAVLFYDVQFIFSQLPIMNPYPGERSVLIMDNCPIHKTARLRGLCEEKGIRLEFLPPYSPDLNPVVLFYVQSALQ